MEQGERGGGRKENMVAVGVRGEGRMEWRRMMERGDTPGGLAVCKETSAAEEFG